MKVMLWVHIPNSIPLLRIASLLYAPNYYNLLGNKGMPRSLTGLLLYLGSSVPFLSSPWSYLLLIFKETPIPRFAITDIQTLTPLCTITYYDHHLLPGPPPPSLPSSSEIIMDLISPFVSLLSSPYCQLFYLL